MDKSRIKRKNNQKASRDDAADYRKIPGRGKGSSLQLQEITGSAYLPQLAALPVPAAGGGLFSAVPVLSDVWSPDRFQKL
jgi:hypothetical protein